MSSDFPDCVPLEKPIIESLLDPSTSNAIHIQDMIRKIRVLLKREVINASDVGPAIQQSILSLAEMPRRQDRDFVPEVIRHNTIGDKTKHLWILTCKERDASSHEFRFFTSVLRSEFTRSQAEEISAILTCIANAMPHDMSDISVSSTQYNYMTAERTMAKDMFKAACRLVKPSHALRLRIPTYSAPQASTAKSNDAAPRDENASPSHGMKLRTNIVDPATGETQDWSIVLRTSVLKQATAIPDVSTNIIWTNGSKLQPMVQQGEGMPDVPQSMIPDDLNIDDETLLLLQKAEKLARIILAHISGLVISTEDANTLFKFLVELYGGFRDHHGTKLYKGKVLYHTDRHVVMRNQSMVLNKAVCSDLSKVLPAVSTRHIDKQWLLPSMDVCDTTWISTGDPIEAWLAAADAADASNIQIRAGEKPPEVCVCINDSQRKSTFHPCSSCGDSFLCSTLVFGLFHLKVCVRCATEEPGKSESSSTLNQNINTHHGHSDRPREESISTPLPEQPDYDSARLAAQRRAELANNPYLDPEYPLPDANDVPPLSPDTLARLLSRN